MTFLIRNNETLDDNTIPVMNRDPLIKAGSMFLFDFLDPFCNPYADNYSFQVFDKFYNMVSNGADAVVAAGNTYIANLTGKTGLNLNSTTYKEIQFGAAGSFNPSDLTNEILIIVWLKLASDFSSSAYRPVIRLGTGGLDTQNQWKMDTGSAGNNFRLQFSNGTQLTNQSPTMAANTVLQLAWSIKPGNANTYSTYINGVLFTNLTNPAGLTSLLNVPANPILFGDFFKGTLYRAYEENISISQVADPSVTALKQVQADYAANVARFT